MSFAHDFANVFRNGIISEPPIKPDTAVTRELERSSTFKKTALDIKERRKLGKRILKTVQSQLEKAVQAEADISSKPRDRLVADLEQLLETTYVAGPDSIAVSLGDAGSLAETEVDQDTAMAENHDQSNERATRSSPSKIRHADTPASGSGDVEMQDVDATGEDVDDDTVFPLTTGDDTINIDTALLEVNGNVSQVKMDHTNGIKQTGTPPDTNGYVSSQEVIQPSPPTPPVSNGDTTSDQADILNNGGIPYYLKDFGPEGTTLLQGGDVMSSFGDELSEMDDEELKGLGVDFMADPADVVGTAIAAIPAPKAKKGKAKKKGGRRR